jgi:hypothetical protein
MILSLVNYSSSSEDEETGANQTKKPGKKIS